MLSETYHGHLSQNILKITILIAMHLNEKTIPGVYIHVLLELFWCDSNHVSIHILITKPVKKSH